MSHHGNPRIDCKKSLLNASRAGSGAVSIGQIHTMALVNDHVTDASEKKNTGEAPGSTAVARSAGSAAPSKRQSLDLISQNNKVDAEYQLPVTADAKATWVSVTLSYWSSDKSSRLHLSTYVTSAA